MKCCCLVSSFHWKLVYMWYRDVGADLDWIDQVHSLDTLGCWNGSQSSLASLLVQGSRVWCIGIWSRLGCRAAVKQLA